MNLNKVLPTTLHGIKQLAKTIKRELNITHAIALDRAALQAGFQNYSHANTALETLRLKVQQYGVFISCGWKDKVTLETGREVYRLGLTKKFVEILRPRDIALIAKLEWFAVYAVDNLTDKRLASTKEIARTRVNEVTRIIQFLDATKLRPSSGYSKAYPEGKPENKIPGEDHAQIWFDPATKGYLITDEPYDFSIQGKLQEREVWSRNHSFNLAKTVWGGMHYPGGGTSMYLLGSKSSNTTFEVTLAAINRMPKAIQDDHWCGESGPSLPMFFSEVGSQNKPVKVKTATVPEKASASSKKDPTTTYVQTFGGSQKRPNGRMSIEVHTQVGKLLQEVFAETYHRRGAHGRIDSVRSELDEWVQREYTALELPGQQFFDLYYHGPNVNYSRKGAGEKKDILIEKIELSRSLIFQSYTDCAPLRSVVKRLDMAITSLEGWK
jgi:Domain of unknown function (DUF5623)